MVQFASLEDRDYYLNKDPAHRAFAETVLGGERKLVEKVVIVDYEVGVF